MALEQLLDFLQIALVQSLECRGFEVATFLERPVFVQYISYPARHAGGKIPSRCADNDDPTPSHILAAVISHTFDYGANTAVAHAEAFASHTANIRLATGSAVKSDIANDDVFLRSKSRTLRRIQNHLAARETLTKVVVRVTLQFERHAGRNKFPKALTGGPFKVKMDRIFRQTLWSKPSGNFTAKNRPNHAIGITDV